MGFVDILAFLLLLPLIIFVHELGHFIFAKINGVKVLAFSIGFGKELIGWTDKSGVRWKIAMIPLGGYVRIFGQSDTPETAEAKHREMEKMADEKKKAHFEFKNRFQRATIMFAGSFFNILFTFFVLFVLFVSAGKFEQEVSIGEVKAESAAMEAGIKEGDKILEVNGDKVRSIYSIIRRVTKSEGEEVKVLIERDGKEKNIEVTPKKVDDKYMIGVQLVPEYKEAERLPFGEAVGEAYRETRDMIVGMYIAISQITSVKEVGGLVSIAKVSGSALETGAYAFFYLMAFISLNLGIINLLPIPMLDGGHLFILGVESAIRRDLPDKIKEKLFLVGFIFVIGLMILVNVNDIIRLFK